MSRRPPIASLLVSAALGIVLLAACGSADNENDSDLTTPPLLGACRSLEPKDLVAATNHSVTVDCQRPHTAQTFVVGDLPTSTGAGYDDPGHGRYVYDTCQKALGAHLGAEESTVLRSRLSWSWFRPSEKGWTKGARWFRCDVIGGPAEATELRNLPTETQGMFANDFPDAWLTCARGQSTDQDSKVACDQPHDWRAVTTVKIDEPGAPYPGDRIVEVRSRDFCRDSVRAWLGYPPDFDFSYTWFREDRWAGGNRRSICWARTTK